MKRFIQLRQAGLTLIELMISVAIGLFILAIIGGIYISSLRSFSTTNAMTGMDENARAVFNIIGNSARHAGFNGCGRIPGILQGDTRGGGVGNWWQNTNEPVRGVADGSTTSLAGAIAGTGALMLVGVDPAQEASVISDDGATIKTGSHNFISGQALLATNCKLNSFFINTSGPGNVITHAASANCSAQLATNCARGGAWVATPYVLSPGSLIMPVVANAYYIANSGTPGKGRSLWTCTTGANCIELANGVENMALWFGVDTTASGSINNWVQPGSVADWTQVVAVRMHLLLATQPDSGAPTTGSNQYTFNGATVTPADNRVYREYTTVFSVRNRNF